MRKRIALTGGIACGKSLVAEYLREHGLETLDADDIVHELIPSAAERKRLAASVFADPGARKAIEEWIHPIVRKCFDVWYAEPCRAGAKEPARVAVIPLLFEAGWEESFDTIICVTSPRDVQIARMMKKRRYTRAEAESRIAAQMDVAEKARRSDIVIVNDGSAEDLRARVADLVASLV